MDSQIDPFNIFEIGANLCPYCCNFINLTDESCPICGYNLFYENDFDFEDDDNFEDGIFINKDNVLSVMSGLYERFGRKYKLEDINYGKQYPTSYDLDQYRILKFIDEYHNLEVAFYF